MTNVNTFTLMIEKYPEKIAVDGKKRKEEWYRLVLTDADIPQFKFYSTKLMKLDQITSHRAEIFSDSNVHRIGFSYLSTKIKKGKHGYYVDSSLQGHDNFQSQEMPLDLATLAYDTILTRYSREKVKDE